MSDKNVKLFAYLFGGLGLVGLSRIAPTAAVSFTSVVLLGVLFANTQQFTVLVNRVVEAVNGDSQGPKPIAETGSTTNVR